MVCRKDFEELTINAIIKNIIYYFFPSYLPIKTIAVSSVTPLKILHICTCLGRKIKNSFTLLNSLRLVKYLIKKIVRQTSVHKERSIKISFVVETRCEQLSF